MPTWMSPRESAYFEVRGCLTQLTSRDIALPDSVTTAVATLDRVEATLPAEPAHDAIRKAVLEGADQGEIDRLVLADLAHARLAAEWRQAQVGAAGRVMAAVRAAHDDLFPQLKALADKQIDHLTAAAKLDSTDISVLVRRGDHQSARLVAELDVVAAELATLYEIRDEHLTPGGPDKLRLGPVDASQWRDPARPGRGDTPAERYVDGLTSGNELWFPTAPEAIEAAQPAHARAKAEAQRIAEIRRAQTRDSLAFAR